MLINVIKLRSDVCISLFFKKTKHIFNNFLLLYIQYLYNILIITSQEYCWELFNYEIHNFSKT